MASGENTLDGNVFVGIAALRMADAASVAC